MFSRIPLLLAEVVFPLACLIAAGAVWKRIYASEAQTLRQQLNALILNVFSPALVFAVIAATPFDVNLLRVPLLVAVGILLGAALIYYLLWHTRLGAELSNETRAALMICGMFGNVFFFGYPVLTFLFGPSGGRYPAYIDLLASIPLVWTLGVWVAVRLGETGTVERFSLGRVMVGLPPVWAFFLGVAYHYAGLGLTPLVTSLQWIGQTAIPLASFVLGLSIPWHALRPSGAILAVSLVKLIVMPLALLALVLLAAQPPAEPDFAAIIEAAMPSMAMGVMLADRFGLDVGAAALATAWTTLLFCLTLPIWLMLLNLAV